MGVPGIGLPGVPKAEGCSKASPHPPTSLLPPREQQVTLFSPESNRRQAWGALTKHPSAVLAEDAGQVLLALCALVPVWNNHRARGGWSGHGWAPGRGREMAEC